MVAMNRYILLSRWSLLAALSLALVFVVPVAWFPFQLAKVAVFATLLLLSAGLFVCGRALPGLVRSPGFWLALGVFSLPLAYLVSMYFSLDRSVALVGFNAEADTVLFVMLASIAFFLSFALFRSPRAARSLVGVVFVALLVAAAFQCVSIVFGSAAIPFASFADRSVNLIGKWNDLGLLVGLLALLLLAWAELNVLSKIRRAAAGVLLMALAVLLGIIGFTLVWWLLLVASLALTIVVFLRERPHGEGMRAVALRAPWFALAGAAVAILFLFFGAVLNTRLTSVFPVTSLEVRPSYQSTLTIIDAARLSGQDGGSLKRTLVGTGPNTFGQQWLLRKPIEVNQSPFWNLDFNVGFSTLETALGTAGVLGALAWLIPLLLVVAASVRFARRAGQEGSEPIPHQERTTALVLVLATLFLWSSIALYVSGQTIILLAFVLAGAAFGFLWRGTPRGGMRFGTAASWVLAVLLILATVWTAAASARRTIAESYVGQGLAALSGGNATQALSLAARAKGIESQNGDVLHLTLSASTARLQQIAQDTSLKAADAQTQFTGTLTSGISAAQASIQAYPNDYRSYLLLGNLYEFLATLKVQNAAQNAQGAYLAAAVKNPTDPEIPLALARLAAEAGNLKLTQQYLTQALTLKPDYTDAILLVVQLDVAQNDTQGAIAAAKAAAQTAPGVASIWFELGLLYYSAGDTLNAIQPLEQALTLVSEYANAKYFLGLSYYAQKQPAKAVQQFKDLAQSNPDNAEVALVLKNMQVGKPPFTGAPPPATPPQQRNTAPVTQ